MKYVVSRIFSFRFIPSVKGVLIFLSDQCQTGPRQQVLKLGKVRLQAYPVKLTNQPELSLVQPPTGTSLLSRSPTPTLSDKPTKQSRRAAVCSSRPCIRTGVERFAGSTELGTVRHPCPAVPPRRPCVIGTARTGAERHGTRHAQEHTRY